MENETTFMEDFAIAYKDRPRTMGQALSFAHTRAWYFVVKLGIVDTPAEKLYTDKCIKNAKEKWAHLPRV